MAKKIGYEYRPNIAGVREIMRSTEMQQTLFGYAEGVVSRLAGLSKGAFSARPIGEPVTGKVSAHAFVITENYEAAHDQAYHNVLNKAL